MNRRNAIFYGLCTFFGLAGDASVVTHNSKSDTAASLLAALSAKTGGQWEMKVDGLAERETSNGGRIYKEVIGFNRFSGEGSTQYFLAILSNKKSVEFTAGPSDGFQALSAQPGLEAEDKKIIQALTSAPTDIFSKSNSNRAGGFKDERINKIISNATGVDMEAIYYDTDVVFESRQNDGSIGVRYTYNYNNSRWLVSSAAIESQATVMPNGEIVDITNPEVLSRSFPAVTGYGVRVRDHMITLVQVARNFQSEPATRSGVLPRLSVPG